MLTKGAERVVEMTRFDISDDAAPGGVGSTLIDRGTHTKMFSQASSEGQPGRGGFAPRTLCVSRRSGAFGVV